MLQMTKKCDGVPVFKPKPGNKAKACMTNTKLRSKPVFLKLFQTKDHLIFHFFF